MAYEYERIIGIIGDLIEGDGSKAMAKYIDCPQCGRPLNITIGPDKSIDLECSVDPSHMQWHGHFDHLPTWINEYKRLNT